MYVRCMLVISRLISEDHISVKHTGEEIRVIIIIKNLVMKVRGACPPRPTAIDSMTA